MNSALREALTYILHEAEIKLKPRSEHYTHLSSWAHSLLLPNGAGRASLLNPSSVYRGLPSLGFQKCKPADG